MQSDTPAPRVRGRLKIETDRLAESPDDVVRHYGAEVLFGVLLWLVRLGTEYDARHHQNDYPGNPSTRCLREAIRGLHGSYHDWGMVGVPAASWRENLAACFRAVVRPTGDAPAPFARAGFVAGARVIVSAPHTVSRGYGSREHIDCAATQRTNQLADYIGRELASSPNEFHPAARWIEDVRIVVTGEGYAADVWYGFEREHGSHWQLHHGESSWAVPPVRGESFAAFLDRAHAALRAAVRPAREVVWSAYPIAQPHMRPSHDIGHDTIIGFVLAQSAERALAYWRENEPSRPGDVEAVIGSETAEPVAVLPAPDTWRECAVRMHRAGEWGAAHMDRWRIHSDLRATLVRMSGAPYRSATEERPFRGWILREKVS